MKESIEENNKLNNNLTELQRNLDALESEKHYLRLENDEYIQKFEEFLPKLSELEEAQKIMQGQEIQISSLKIEVSNYQELYNDIKSRFERERQGNIEILKSLNEQLIASRNDLRNNKDEGTKLNVSIANLLEETKNYKEQLEKKQKQVLCQNI